MIKHVLEKNGIYFVPKTIFFVGKKLNTVIIFYSQLYMFHPHKVQIATPV